MPPKWAGKHELLGDKVVLQHIGRSRTRNGQKGTHLTQRRCQYWTLWRNVRTAQQHEGAERVRSPQVLEDLVFFLSYCWRHADRKHGIVYHISQRSTQAHKDMNEAQATSIHGHERSRNAVHKAPPRPPVQKKTQQQKYARLLYDIAS